MIIVKLRGVLAKIDGDNIICDDDRIKEALLLGLKLSDGNYGPQHGFLPGLFEFFGDEIEFISSDNEDDVIY